MTTTVIGTTFPPTSDWHVDEVQLINNIKSQIEQAFPDSENLFINSTWFGPQFNNGQWDLYQQLISGKKFHKLFLLAAADPVFLTVDQISNMQQATQSELYLLGHFDTQYYFNFYATVLPKYFVPYTQQQLILNEPRFVFLNYNRKPRDHRNALVNKLKDKNLLDRGIVTLGKEDHTYSKTINPQIHLTLNESIDDAVGNWGMDMSFGIPHDIHSLGQMHRWRDHFLNVVGETEFYPWDNMFISEKTWKPIIGLRPFVINGQTKIYKYLRSNGFKTFEKYFNDIELEDVAEYEVHDSIVSLIEYFSKMTSGSIKALYQDMLPDLIHNRNRFSDYSREQINKINNLFN
jgi:hypothetical protein